MQCPYCLKEIVNDVKECNHCGELLPKPEFKPYDVDRVVRPYGYKGGGSEWSKREGNSKIDIINKGSSLLVKKTRLRDTKSEAHDTEEEIELFSIDKLEAFLREVKAEKEKPLGAGRDKIPEPPRLVN